MTTRETNEVDFSEYELDRDIPDTIWNNYLKKYKREFILFYGEEGTWKIKCKFGQIEPYSLKKKYLLFYGKFPTPQKKAYFLRNLRENVEKVQEGYDECVCKFLEKSLFDLSGYFSIRRRVKLSEAEKERRRQLMKEMREKAANTHRNLPMV